MNDDQLKEAWHKLGSNAPDISFDSTNLGVTMEQEINRFEKRIRDRDRREIMTASALLLFVLLLVITSDGYQKVGFILLCGYLAWVIFYLTRAKLRKPGFSISKSLKEHLVDYRSYVLLQQRLVRNVLYWYILPLVPGMLFLCLNLESTFLRVAVLSGNVLILVYVYRLNQRAAKENYTDLLMELDQAIQNLER